MLGVQKALKVVLFVKSCHCFSALWAPGSEEFNGFPDFLEKMAIPIDKETDCRCKSWKYQLHEPVLIVQSSRMKCTESQKQE